MEIAIFHNMIPTDKTSSSLLIESGHILAFEEFLILISRGKRELRASSTILQKFTERTHT
jgi:hypothetical protein